MGRFIKNIIRKTFIYLIALVLSILLLFGAGYLTLKEYLRNEDQIKADFLQLLDVNRFFYYEAEKEEEEIPSEESKEESKEEAKEESNQ
jgi:hypothetical protein